MSVIDCDYLTDPAKTKFPPELALLIVRKAGSMAEAFEQQALDQLTKDAISAIFLSSRETPGFSKVRRPELSIFSPDSR